MEAPRLTMNLFQVCRTDTASDEVGFLMAFLLLARSTDESLTLLSHEGFDSRQEALAALAALTADPAFSRWDDEVLLLDIDSATPVLLVRPAAPAVPLEFVAEIEEPIDALSDFAAQADEGPIEISEISVSADSVIEIVEPAHDVSDGLLTEDAPDAEPVSSIDIDEAARSFIAEAVAENSGVVLEEQEPAIEAAVNDTSLLEALTRTTIKMEADGIVAPASIGAVEQPDSDEPVSVDSEEESAVEDRLEAIAEDLGLPPSEPDSDDGMLTEVDAPVPEAPVWPWDVATESPAEDQAQAEPEDEAQVEAEANPEPDEVTESVVAEKNEPVSDISEPGSAGGLVLEGLEEPAVDAGGSLIATTIDDEGYAAARPVILGAYGERATDVEIDDEEIVGPIDPTLIPDEPETAEADADSDFIIIGESAGPGEISAGTSGEQASPLADYTCNECVYVETCPNKDQRRPEDCGSFQWK